MAARRSDGRFVIAPTGDQALAAGDALMVYGRSEAIEALSGREWRG